MSKNSNNSILLLCISCHNQMHHYIAKENILIEGSSCKFPAEDQGCLGDRPGNPPHFMLGKTPRFWTVQPLSLPNGIVDAREHRRPVVILCWRSINLKQKVKTLAFGNVYEHGGSELHTKCLYHSFWKSPSRSVNARSAIINLSLTSRTIRGSFLHFNNPTFDSKPWKQ